MSAKLYSSIDFRNQKYHLAWFGLQARPGQARPGGQAALKFLACRPGRFRSAWPGLQSRPGQKSWPVGSSGLFNIAPRKYQTKMQENIVFENGVFFNV